MTTIQAIWLISALICAPVYLYSWRPQNVSEVMITLLFCFGLGPFAVVLAVSILLIRVGSR